MTMKNQKKRRKKNQKKKKINHLHEQVENFFPILFFILFGVSS